MNEWRDERIREGESLEMNKGEEEEAGDPSQLEEDLVLIFHQRILGQLEERS